MSAELSRYQRDIADFPDKGTLFVTGPAGTGKTTAAVERLRVLCTKIDDPGSILILAPQRSLALPYLQAIRSPEFYAPAPQSVMTLGGLAQRSISLFWPLISRDAGFKEYKKPPVFLTLELTQFYLARLVDPLIQKGYFSGITVDRLRLYSQIIDNLNKSAVVGFDPASISERLTSAWSGKTDQTSIFSQAQECALLFRGYCLEHNLLDFSLQLSIFKNFLWKSFIFRKYLKETYRHLIYENIEEDYPIAHDIIQEWLPDFQSATLIRDENGGFRTFLGADPHSADRFSKSTDKVIRLDEIFSNSNEIKTLSISLSEAILEHKITNPIQIDIKPAFNIQTYRYVPETLDAVASQIKSLVEEHDIPASEIALLTPFLSDSLLFSAINRFKSLEIPVTAFRPSRGLKDEPIIKAMLTSAKLAFPTLGLIPNKEDVRNSLMAAISDCDLIRADLLAKMLFSSSNKQPAMRALDLEKNELRNRITRETGEKFEHLRNWLAEFINSQETELDIFFSRIFGEVLSQPGYALHTDAYQASLINQLIHSCRKFRQILNLDEEFHNMEFSRIYIEQLESGILSSIVYREIESRSSEGSVLIAPAHSFLMKNKSVKYQFWLDIGSSGWWARLDQPLTQPYVLNRNWNEGSRWTDVEEYASNQKNLARLVDGLLTRCSEKVFLISINVNQQGNEERGPLMVAVQTLLKRLSRDGMALNV